MHNHMLSFNKAFRFTKWYCEKCKMYSIILIITYCGIIYILFSNKTRVQSTIQSTHIMPFYHFINNNNSNIKFSQLIIPNIVHFIRFNQSEITFVDCACILAAFKNQNPDIIYIHTNSNNLTGKYWKYLLKIPKFREIHRINYIEIPKCIYGQKLSDKWWLQHASDVTRIRILIQYGGIFLDNDSYINKNLDIFRKFEMVVGWDHYYNNLGTQVLLAHPNARFLKLWLEFYRNNYNQSSWYFNAGKGPSDYILAKNPNLVLKIYILLGVHNMGPLLYQSCNISDWKDMYFTTHFLVNHRHYLDAWYVYFPQVTYQNVFYMNNTFGELLRTLFWGNDYLKNYFNISVTKNCLNPV